MWCDILIGIERGNFADSERRYDGGWLGEDGGDEVDRTSQTTRREMRIKLCESPPAVKKIHPTGRRDSRHALLDLWLAF